MSDQEIKITDEMIEVGAAAIRRWDDRYSDEEALAEEVFRLMLTRLNGYVAPYVASSESTQ